MPAPLRAAPTPAAGPRPAPGFSFSLSKLASLVDRSRGRNRALQAAMPGRRRRRFPVLPQ